MRHITPGDLTQFGINVSHTGALTLGSVLGGTAGNFVNPYSQQITLGVEREVASGWVISASYVFVHTVKLPRSVDANLLSAPTTTINGVTIRNWKAGACVVPGTCFVDPTIGQNNVYVSNGSAVYHAGILEVKKRFSNHFSLTANYTYSKALDDVTDYIVDYSAFDQFNSRGERSLSSFDQRHKFVLAAVMESPWDGALSGFTLSPIFRANSGRPFNLLAGEDINGDRHITNDRPLGDGRNTGVGPNFFAWDMRLAKRIKVAERASLNLMVEGLNLLNRTNYATVNNVVENISGPFGLSGTNAVSPSTPLGFTSALSKRELQFGARLAF